MKSEYIAELLSQPERLFMWGSTARNDSRQLEVNVIHTEPQATAAALNAAAVLALGLRACIHVLAAISVPRRLPIDQSPVSVQFVEKLLRDLVGRINQQTFESTVHLYVCRDRIETYLDVLKPNSLVLIGGRDHFWPTAASRMAKELRLNGHDVVFVETATQVVRVMQ